MLATDMDEGEAVKESIKDTMVRESLMESWLLDLGNDNPRRALCFIGVDLRRPELSLKCWAIDQGLCADILCKGNEITITVMLLGTLLSALTMLLKLRKTAELFNVAPHFYLMTCYC